MSDESRQRVRHAVDNQWDMPPSNMRLVSVGDQRPPTAQENCWTVPARCVTTSLSNILMKWTPVLKEAVYVSLRRRGNARRQLLVKEQVSRHVDQNTTHYWWAAFTAASTRQPYWSSTDLTAARRQLRLRAGQACNEGYTRSREFVQAISAEYEVRLPRIADRSLRACYMCGPIEEAVDARVFWPDSLEHMVIACKHPDLVRAREQARLELTAIAHLAPGHPAPDFTDNTSLFTALMLATAIGPISVLQAAPVLTGTPVQRRDGPQLAFSPSVAGTTSAWVSAITAPWVSQLRTTHDEDTVDSTPGGRLVSLVLKTTMAMFMAHNRECRGHRNAEFQVRARDVSPNVPRPSTRARAQAERAEKKRARKVAKAKKKKPIAVSKPARVIPVPHVRRDREQRAAGRTSGVVNSKLPPETRENCGSSK